jgi:hypothetical protein
MISAVPFAALILLSSPMEGRAGLNPDFRIVLHAKQSLFEPCNGYLPLDCTNNPPTVNVQPAPVTVFVLLANYVEASAIETAFSWTGWSHTFSNWECGLMCDPGACNFFPPGAMGGTVSGSFPNCVTSPNMKLIGTMAFVPAGNPQCIRQVLPDSPDGIHVFDCNGEMDQILDPESLRLGRICVGSGGVNGCPPITGVGAPATSAPARLTVGPSQPNPFNPQTTLTYTLADAAEVTVTVFDATGRVVRELHRGAQIAGPHTITWDGRDDQGATLSSGVYHLRVEAAGQTKTQKIVLLK